MVKLNAKQLRSGVIPATAGIQEDGSRVKPGMTDRNEIYIILDNILDTYNIGSIFRLADAVAAKKVILCAGSVTPPNHRIKKASVNTTEWVEWSYAESAAVAIRNLQFTIPNLQTVAVEQTKDSISYDKFDYSFPLALVVGHETDGVSKEALELCDRVVELPMFGVNISLNVMVSLAIIMYKALEKVDTQSTLR